jgi:hypothetical protein
LRNIGGGRTNLTSRKGAEVAAADDDVDEEEEEEKGLEAAAAAGSPGEGATGALRRKKWTLRGTESEKKGALSII